MQGHASPASRAGIVHLRTTCQGRETIPPRGADPKHPCNMLFRRTVVPGQRGGQDRRDIGHPGVMGGAPFHRQVRTELCPEQRLDLRTGAISQREESLAGKAGAAEEHAHLRKRERRPVQGDPRGVADDREPTVPVTPRAMRRQTAQAGASRQEVAPEGAVLRQVLAGDPRPGALCISCPAIRRPEPIGYHTTCQIA